VALADQTPNMAEAFLQPGPAIGIVRPQRQCFQQGGKIAIRNCEAAQIDRSGERPISEPLPKPIPHRNPVEPQRRTDERLEKLLALQWAEPRNAKRNPLVKIAADAGADMLRYTSEFGLTPIARTRLAAGGFEPPSTSKFAGLIGNGTVLPMKRDDG
jgi:hypothetical protein